MSTRIDQTRRAAETTGRAYAEDCVTAAFEQIRETYPDAAVLLVDKDEDEDGDTLVTLVAVRRADGAWLRARDVYDPRPSVVAGDGAELDFDSDETAEVEEHLRNAYDSPGLPVMDPAGPDDYAGLRNFRSWHLLRVEMAAPRPESTRTVVVEGIGGDAYRFPLDADDSVIVHVDGVALMGVIGNDGPGWWPDGDGDDWQPLVLGAKVIERGMRVLGINETQFYGLSERLHLPRSHFGRFKGGPDDPRDINLRDRSWSCGDRFDAAVAYVAELGLAYDLTVETKYEWRPQPQLTQLPGNKKAE